MVLPTGLSKTQCPASHFPRLAQRSGCKGDIKNPPHIPPESHREAFGVTEAS